MAFLLRPSSSDCFTNTGCWLNWIFFSRMERKPLLHDQVLLMSGFESAQMPSAGDFNTRSRRGICHLSTRTKKSRANLKCLEHWASLPWQDLPVRSVSFIPIDSWSPGSKTHVISPQAWKDLQLHGEKDLIVTAASSEQALRYNVHKTCLTFSCLNTEMQYSQHVRYQVTFIQGKSETQPCTEVSRSVLCKVSLQKVRSSYTWV